MNLNRLKSYLWHQPSIEESTSWIRHSPRKLTSALSEDSSPLFPPSFPQGSPFNHPKENPTLYAAIKQEYYAWTICRKFGSDGKQPVPALGEFISATGSPPLRKQPLFIYFIPIHQPITDYSTVQELLKRSEVATAEVSGEKSGQKYVINTFDLGVCMKAHPLISKYSER